MPSPRKKAPNYFDPNGPSAVDCGLPTVVEGCIIEFKAQPGKPRLNGQYAGMKITNGFTNLIGEKEAVLAQRMRGGVIIAVRAIVFAVGEGTGGAVKQLSLPSEVYDDIMRQAASQKKAHADRLIGEADAQKTEKKARMAARRLAKKSRAEAREELKNAPAPVPVANHLNVDQLIEDKRVPKTDDEVAAAAETAGEDAPTEALAYVAVKKPWYTVRLTATGERVDGIKAKRTEKEAYALLDKFLSTNA